MKSDLFISNNGTSAPPPPLPPRQYSSQPTVASFRRFLHVFSFFSAASYNHVHHRCVACTTFPPTSHQLASSSPALRSNYGLVPESIKSRYSYGPASHHPILRPLLFTQLTTHFGPVIFCPALFCSGFERRCFQKYKRRRVRHHCVEHILLPRGTGQWQTFAVRLGRNTCHYLRDSAPLPLSRSTVDIIQGRPSLRTGPPLYITTGWPETMLTCTHRHTCR